MSMESPAFRHGESSRLVFFLVELCEPCDVRVGVVDESLSDVGCEVVSFGDGAAHDAAAIPAEFFLLARVESFAVGGGDAYGGFVIVDELVELLVGELWVGGGELSDGDVRVVGELGELFAGEVGAAGCAAAY